MSVYSFIHLQTIFETAQVYLWHRKRETLTLPKKAKDFHLGAQIQVYPNLSAIVFQLSSPSTDVYFENCQIS